MNSVKIHLIFRITFSWFMLFLVMGPLALAIENVCPTFFVQLMSSLTPNQQLRLGTLIKKDPELAADAAEIFKLIPRIQSGEISVRDPHLLDIALRCTSKLQNTGKLPDLLHSIAEQAKTFGKVPKNIPPEKLEAMINLTSTVIDAELSARGLTKVAAGVHYEPWNSLASRLTFEVNQSIEKAYSKSPLRGFKNPEFVKAFEKQVGSKFSKGNQIKLLIDGPASFAERTRAITNAKKKIDVMSWAFYDDVTGTTFGDLLIRKAKEGMDVRVMVDGQVAMQPEHMATLKKMEENGVKVVRWKSKNPLRRFDGQHRKVVIVDDEEMIAGGMNFGDVYSHLGPETTAKWRDTDVHVKGPAVQDAKKLFASIWNEQDHPSKVILEAPPVLAKTEPSTAKIAIVNHQPGKGENIYRANLMAIEGATQSIDIENAYFILDPAIYKSLLRAKDRGVKIRILTNSVHSVDEPIVSYPIMESVNRLAKQNFEVYVKDGTNTLHSKSLTIDNIYSWVGSHNFHPRSFRYEGEVTINALDQDFATSVKAMFQADINKAIRIKEPIKLPPNLQADAVGYYLYDQL